MTASTNAKVGEPLFIALDIGGTKIMAAAADISGTILERLREPTPADLTDGLDCLHQMITRLSRRRKIIAIGAAIGGPLDWEQGVVSPLHQPAWRQVPLKAIMTEKWHCPFYVDVDTNIAALGEYYFGENRVSRLLYLTLSTGMGGGLLVQGKIYRGRAGVHPEFGHQAIPWRCRFPQRIACECGAPDCLEALISGNGIRRIYNKPAENLSEDEWAEVAFNLGQGLRNLAVLHAPDEIILGGGIAVGRGERLIASAVATMKKHLKLVPAPVIRLSRLGYDTALLGAVAAAQHGIA